MKLFRETATRGRFHQQLHRVTPSDSWNFFAFPRRDSFTKSRTVFYSCNGGNRKLGIAPCNTRSWNFFALQFHEKVSPCNIGLKSNFFDKELQFMCTKIINNERNKEEELIHDCRKRETTATSMAPFESKEPRVLALTAEMQLYHARESKRSSDKTWVSFRSFFFFLA